MAKKNKKKKKNPFRLACKLGVLIGAAAAAFLAVKQESERKRISVDEAEKITAYIKEETKKKPCDIAEHKRQPSRAEREQCLHAAAQAAAKRQKQKPAVRALRHDGDDTKESDRLMYVQKEQQDKTKELSDYINQKIAEAKTTKCKEEP